MQNKGIIIIGDWIIDYYRFLARHQSDTSSFAGYNHYKVASKFGHIVAALCGAGHTAKVIHENDLLTKTKLDVNGFGFWHEQDTQTFVDLVQKSEIGNEHFANARFGGKAKLRGNPNHILLHTLSPEADTLQTDRLYQYSGGNLKQLARIDFDRNGHGQLAKAAVGTVKQFSPTHDITGIIVHDLGKGAIFDQLIDALRAKFPGAWWYVRSKNGTQEWIRKLNDQAKLILNVAGPETTSIESSWNKWILYGKPTLDGIRYKGPTSCN
jgi:hypothetical protein